MKPSVFSRPGATGRVIAYAVAAVAVLVAYATRERWIPALKAQLAAWVKEPRPEASGEHKHERGQDEASSIQVSEQGLKNIGFVPWKVELRPFAETVTIPATVVERSGRSQIQVAAPLTGRITRIHGQEGMAVEPDSPLFEMRLTHEEVVVAQRDFLRTAESLDVVNREITRLQKTNVGGESAIAGKRIIEQEYEKQKLEASLRADRQALYLHGLSEPQVNNILQKRELLQTMIVAAPEHAHEGEACRQEHSFHVQKMLVKPGENVQAGQALCTLADHCELFLEGRAFENDAQQLRRAEQRGWDVTAVALSPDQFSRVSDQASDPRRTEKPASPGESPPVGDGELRGLRVLYLADRVDPDTRAFLFYLRLPNELLRPEVVHADGRTPAKKGTAKDGPRYVDWRFKPGQRFDLRVPVKQWKECIKAPIDAVVDEGVETYVFVQNGAKFDRKPVHVEYRDREWAVIANDGSVFLDDVIAGRGAYQLHLAMKNKSGGGVDPHAGHHH